MKKMDQKNVLLLLAVIISLLLAEARAEDAQWEYAQFATFSWQGKLHAEWTTGDKQVLVAGGVLPLAEKVMKEHLSDSDNAFIIWFNYLGSEGWELINVRDVRQDSTQYLFKRKK